MKCATVAHFKSAGLRACCAASYFVYALSPPRKISSQNRNSTVVIDVFTPFLRESENSTTPFLCHFQPLFSNFSDIIASPKGGSAENITVSFFLKSDCAKTAPNENEDTASKGRREAVLYVPSALLVLRRSATKAGLRPLNSQHKLLPTSL